MTDLIGKVFVTEGKYTSKAKKHKEGYTMTRRALGRSESGLLRFSCKVTDFARYDKENFIFSGRVMSFRTKTAKEKVTL
jgi:hypothetical protein